MSSWWPTQQEIRRVASSSERVPGATALLAVAAGRFIMVMWGASARGRPLVRRFNQRGALVSGGADE